MPKPSLRRVQLWTLLALLAAATLRCSGDNVAPRDASAIAMASGNGQTGAVGTALANPLVVLVTDAQGKPVQGASVAWTVSGGGSVSSASTTTGADGKASVSRTLGPAAGQQTTIATASGLSGSPVTFVSVATNGESGIVITTNPPTTALTGEVFDPSVQPVVHVHNADGTPSVGTAVTAAIVSG